MRYRLTYCDPRMPDAPWQTVNVEAPTAANACSCLENVQLKVLEIVSLEPLPAAQPPVIPDPKRESSYPAELIRLNWPELFQQPDFVAYLRQDKVATWHDKHSTGASEYSDLFFWYERGEGSELGTMPDWAWDRITQYLGDEVGIVWISNL